MGWALAEAKYLLHLQKLSKRIVRAWLYWTPPPDERLHEEQVSNTRRSLGCRVWGFSAQGFGTQGLVFQVEGLK